MELFQVHYILNYICYVQNFYIPCTMTMTPSFTEFFTFKICIFKFFYKYKIFLHFQMIPSALLLITFFILVKLIIFLACSLKNLQNIFIQSFPLYTSCLFSIIMLVFYTLDDDIVDTQKLM